MTIVIVIIINIFIIIIVVVIIIIITIIIIIKSVPNCIKGKSEPQQLYSTLSNQNEIVTLLENAILTSLHTYS